MQRQSIALQKGVTDLPQLQALEEEGLAKTLLSRVRVDTPLTSELTRYVHREILANFTNGRAAGGP